MFATRSTSIERDPPDQRSSAWGFGLCWLMFASTALNYMDRQAVSLVGSQIKAEFRLDNEGFGWLMSAFMLPYALFQVPAGYLADRLDVRKTYAAAVAWWSLAGFAAAFSPGLGALLACRALLGIGESFNWPCALRVTASVLEPRDRGLGNGIFNSGAAVGAVLTPLIVTPLAQLFGWRTAFAVVGVFGLAWVVAWLIVSGGNRSLVFAGRKPARESSRLGDARTRLAFGSVVLIAVLIALSSLPLGPLDLVGRHFFAEPPAWSKPLGARAIWWGIAVFLVGILVVARILPSSSLAASSWGEAIGGLVRRRRFWVLTVVSISINVGWHSLINWVPTYLKEDRGLSFLASGMISSIPFLAADAGNLIAGWLARVLSSRGLTLFRARLAIMGTGTLLIAAGVAVGSASNTIVVITLLAMMALGAAMFMALYFTFCQEVDPHRTGFVIGVLGSLGNLFVAAFLPIVGKIKDVTGSFAPVFVLIGLLPIIGLVTLGLGWGNETSVSEQDHLSR